MNQSKCRWLKLNRSGFFFRIYEGKCIQAACIKFSEEQATWILFNPSAGQQYYDRKKELFTTPEQEYLDVLDTVPHYDEDAHEFLLDIVAE